MTHGPRQPFTAYLPKTESISFKINSLTSNPAVAGAGGGKGGAAGKGHREPRTMIRFKEKPVDADVHSPRALPLATFTDNPNRRSAQAKIARSQARRGRKGKGKGTEEA